MTEVAKIYQLVENLSLEVVYEDEESLNRTIKTGEVPWSGLELTGYFNYYSHDRLQLFGNKEITFAERTMSGECLLVMCYLCAEDTPAFIVSRGLEIPEESVTIAKENGVSALRSPTSTSRSLGELSSYLDGRLAVRASTHEVLVDIYGFGISVQGDSGIGKGGAALELIKRGHRLIADGCVGAYQQDELIVVGEPPKILQHLIEIRDIGTTDVINLSRVSTAHGSMQVQLVVYLETWGKDKKCDRLGSDDVMVEIANVDIPQIRVSVKTGRNVIIIVEIAAINFRAKTMGYDVAGTFEERLTRLIGENLGEQKEKM